MRNPAKILLLLCLGLSTTVFSQCSESQSTAFIAHAEVALKGTNINANLQAGIWTRFGGLAAGVVNHAVAYTEETKSSFASLAPKYKQVTTPVATLSGRIVLSDKYLISPYLTAGKGYTEKGVRLGVLMENDMAVGIKGSDQGFGICLAKIF